MATDASLKFTPKTGTTPPPASTHPDEPGILTMPNGRKMRVTIEIKVQGVWKKVDTSKLGDEKLALQKLIDRCQAIYAITTKESGSPKSLTAYFERNDKTESFTSRTLGKIFNYFKEEEIIQLDFKKLEYQLTDADPKQVFDLENEELEPDQTDSIRDELKVLAPIAKAIYYNSRYYTSNPKKIKPPVDPESAIIDQCIKDAGAQGNRCAALSLAKIELEKNKDKIEDIVEKYDLDADLTATLNAAPDVDGKSKILADALIEKAASNIENDDPNNLFLDEEEQDHRRPCLAAIKAAFREMGKQSELDALKTPQKIVKRYAELIRQEGEMLDLPFFLALKQPFIIIDTNSQRQNQIRVLGDNFIIPDTIEKCDLSRVNILFYNSKNHYKAVILSTKEEEKAMRQLIRREMDKQIESLIDRIQYKNEDVGAEGIAQEQFYFMNLDAQYFLALTELIHKLKLRYPTKLTEEIIRQIIEKAIPPGKTMPLAHEVWMGLRKAIHS